MTSMSPHVAEFIATVITIFPAPAAGAKEDAWVGLMERHLRHQPANVLARAAEIIVRTRDPRKRDERFSPRPSNAPNTATGPSATWDSATSNCRSASAINPSGPDGGVLAPTNSSVIRRLVGRRQARGGPSPTTISCAGSSVSRPRQRPGACARTVKRFRRWRSSVRRTTSAPPCSTIRARV